MKLENLIRDNIKALTPYSSARDEFEFTASVYLDANENPFDNGVNRYPDPYQKELKSRLSELKDVPTENILLGNGSDEVLDLLFRAFCEPGKDNIVINPPTYGMYTVLAGINNVEAREVDLTSDFSLDVTGILSAVDKNTKIVFICSPNNPTGNIFNEDAVLELLQNLNCLVVVDEAYIDFSNKKSWSKRLSEFNNLVVCQTLSKAYGMAGIRLGMCFASAEIIQVLNNIKPPYNVNSLTQEKALELLADTEKYSERLEVILSEKERLRKVLTGLSFVETVFPSEANFWLIRVADAKEIYDALLEEGIVIRNLSTQKLCENTLRITVGTKEDNDKLITALKAVEVRNV